MMWMILQADSPEDWVIATGKTNTVRDFVKMSFKEVGVELEFKGKGKEETGVVVSCSNPKYKLPLGKEVVSIDSKYFRPTEVDLLLGDASKAFNKLGWKPKYNLEELIKEMMDADLELIRKSNLK